METPTHDEVPLPTDEEVIKFCTFTGAREALKNKHLVSARHLTGWPVMGGAIVTTDGIEHRNRRKLENVMFTPAHLERYELSVLQPAIDFAISHAAQNRRGTDGLVRVDLVSLTRTMMLSISAAVVGLDLDITDDVRRERLRSCLDFLIKGVTIEWSHEDHDQVLRQVMEWKHIFGEEFVRPALEARRSTAGDDQHTEQQQRPDLIYVLLTDPNREWDFDAILTECVQYLVASSSTTSTAAVHTLHHLFEWLAGHPEDQPLATDTDFLRRAAMDALRLHPGPHILMRRAVQETEVEGVRVCPGQYAGPDVRQANRDPLAYGQEAATFDPHRELPVGVPGDGFTFGGGRHTCIGRPLALGTYGRRAEQPVDGMLVRMVRTILEAGAQPDPDRAPQPVEGVDDRFDAYPAILIGL